MNRADRRRLDAAAAKNQLELRGLDLLERTVKQDVRRARNRLRTRCVREGIWGKVKALSGVPIGDLLPLLEGPGPRDALIVSGNRRGELRTESTGTPARAEEEDDEE